MLPENSLDHFICVNQTAINSQLLIVACFTCHIRLQSYASRSRGLEDIDESLAGDLNPVEKKLLETQDFMKVRGKVQCF